MYEIAKSLIYISMFSVLIPILFLLTKKKNFDIKILKILGLLLLASALSDLLSYIILKIGYKTNIPITNTFFIVQFLLLSILYISLLTKKKMIYISISIALIFFIINTIFFQPYIEMQSYFRGVVNIILILYSILYFFQLLNKMPMITVSILKYYPFWINTAVFYYFGASFLIFFTITYIFKNQSVNFSVIIWSFHNLNNIIKNILFAVAIYFAGRYPNPINPNAIMSDDIDLDNIKL